MIFFYGDTKMAIEDNIGKELDEDALAIINDGAYKAEDFLKPGKKMDLHMHSTFSDGVFTPDELVKMRKDEGFDVVAVTDHDGAKGVKEALAAGEKYGIKVVPGIEIGTVMDVSDIIPEAFDKSMNKGEVELHILGYDIDPDDQALVDQMQKIKDFRDERNKKLLWYFQEKGYDIKYKDLIRNEGQEYVAKPDFAWVFVNRGYVQNVSEAFRSEKFLAAKAVQRLKQMPYPTEDAIKLIQGAGGAAVLAHPMKIKGIGEKGSDEFFSNLIRLITRLKKLGLAGIEVSHPSASPEDTEKLVDISHRTGLKITMGSDYHGPQNKKRA